jgi:sodium/potassium-transporting ATPase subunit alpha
LHKPEEISKRNHVDINTYKPAESKGLSTKEAEKLMKENGPNVLTPPPKKHPLLKYLECLCNLFNLLLMVAGAFTLIVLAIDYKNNKSNVCYLLNN